MTFLRVQLYYARAVTQMISSCAVTCARSTDRRSATQEIKNFEKESRVKRDPSTKIASTYLEKPIVGDFSLLSLPSSRHSDLVRPRSVMSVAAIHLPSKRVHSEVNELHYPGIIS